MEVEYDHEKESYSLAILPLETMPPRNYPNQDRLQVSITLVYHVHHRYFSASDHMAGAFPSRETSTLLLLSQEDARETTLRLHASVLRNPDLAFRALSSKLSSLEIDSEPHQVIVDKIVEFGRRTIQNSIFHKGGAPFSLKAKICRWHDMFSCQSCVSHRAAAPLVHEGRRNNHNKNDMVPAKKSSVKKMLKSVRVVGEEEYGRKRRATRSRCVEEGRTCTVCLEEFGSGGDGGAGTSRASRMPCEHVFHEECIVAWLNRSHYCPVCRFEMPT